MLESCSQSGVQLRMSEGRQMSAVLPVIAINGSVSHGGGVSSINAPGSIGGDYAQLIALGADAFQRSGAKVFDMDAGNAIRWHRPHR